MFPISFKSIVVFETILNEVDVPICVIRVVALVILEVSHECILEVLSSGELNHQLDYQNVILKHLNY